MKSNEKKNEINKHHKIEEKASLSSLISMPRPTIFLSLQLSLVKQLYELFS